MNVATPGAWPSSRDPPATLSVTWTSGNSCCSTTRSWTPATFDHDARFFPINSGRHQGTWSSCSTCHTVPGNFRAFECIVCHEHRRSEMDDEHDDVRGYSYQSSACYSCHPRGNER